MARNARLAIIALGVYLLLLHLTGFLLARRLFDAQVVAAEAVLDLVATSLTEPPRPYYDLLEFVVDGSTGRVDEFSLLDYSTALDWQNITNALTAAARGPVSSLEILSPAGEVILSTAGEVLDRGARLPLEADAVAQAMAGRRAEILPSAAESTRRLFVPIRSQPGARPVAVLRVEMDNSAIIQVHRSRLRLVLGLIASGCVLGFLWLLTMRLVRQTIEAQRAASRADRLRALGTLTAGVAHEVRNPLGIIALQAEELRAIARDIPETGPRAALEKLADDIRAETRRLRDLVENFLRFSRAREDNPPPAAPIDLAAATDRIVRLWSRGLPPGRRTVDLRPAPGPVPVLFTEDRLQQILLNLLRNADEAIGDATGTITISVETRPGTALLTVADTGPGISAENLERIFDPFFTTRAEGTGLGLSLSQAMAEAAGGQLTVASEPGRGARFRLELPIVG